MDYSNLSSSELDSIIKGGSAINEPEVAVEEPIMDNSETTQTDNSEVEQTQQELPNEEIKEEIPNEKIQQEPQKDNSLVDDFIEKYKSELPEEFLKKYKGKSEKDFLTGLHNLEKLMGKKEAEIRALKALQAPTKPETNIEAQNIVDWDNVDEAKNLITLQKMKEIYPDFEGEQTINDLGIISQIDALKMYKKYEEVQKEAEQEFLEIQDLYKNHQTENWNSSLVAVDNIREDLEDRDLKFDDLNINNGMIDNIISDLKAKFPDSPLLNSQYDFKNLDEKLAFVLIVDSNTGETDERLFENKRGIKILNPEIVKRKFDASTADLRKTVKEQRKKQQEERIKQEKFEAEKEGRKKGYQSAIEKKPVPSLTNANVPNKTAIPIKPKEISKMSTKEIDDLLISAIK
jgi:hypothetical protein